MTTYTYANAQRSLVLRDEMIIFWHPHADMPCDRKDGERWLADGSPKPRPFDLNVVGPELDAQGAMTGYKDTPQRREVAARPPPVDPDAPPPPTTGASAALRRRR